MFFPCIGILLIIPWSIASLTNEGNIIACDALNNMDDRLFLIDNNLRTMQKKIQASNTIEAQVATHLSSLDKKLNILTNVESKMNEIDTKLEKVLTKIGNIENDVEHLKFSFQKSVIKTLNETNPTSIIEKNEDESNLKINDLGTKLNLVPLKLDEISVKINVLEQSIKYINDNLEKRKEDDVLNKINKIENNMEHLKNSFERSDIKNLLINFETNQTATIEKNQDELKFEMDALDKKLNLVPLRLDEILIKIHVLEASSKRIDDKLEKQNENEVLENVLNKINNVENNTEYLKQSFDKSNMNITSNMEKVIEKCNESKGTNKNITITAETLSLENPDDYTLCNSVKNQSGVFKFHTSSTNLIEKSRDYSVRLCEKGWLVIQNRNSFDYQENFNRPWNEYKNGFGDLRKEFWIGNEFLHRLSYTNDLMLRIELESFDNEIKWAEYDLFKVDSDHENYRLNLGGFTGTLVNTFDYHNKMPFTTSDRDNDFYTGGNCAMYYKGGWWYNNCHLVYLNGLYHKVSKSDLSSIFWYDWLKFNSLKSSKMMVKPKKNTVQFKDLTFKTVINP